MHYGGLQFATLNAKFICFKTGYNRIIFFKCNSIPMFQYLIQLKYSSLKLNIVFVEDAICCSFNVFFAQCCFYTNYQMKALKLSSEYTDFLLNTAEGNCRWKVNSRLPECLPEVKEHVMICVDIGPNLPNIPCLANYTSYLHREENSHTAVHL